MILTAGLLVLAGLGLFVGGLVTGTTAWYWACVACCAVAAGLLAAVRLRPAPPAGPVPSASRPPSTTVPARGRTPGDGPDRDPDAERAPPPSAPAPAAVAAEPSPAARAPVPGRPDGEPPEEEVEVTDLLLVVDLREEVLVVDGQPRYHLAGCRWSAGRATVPRPVADARRDGFTPCGICTPDARLAQAVRARRRTGGP